MKKLMLLAAVAVFSLSNVNAQELRAGLTGGIPMGSYSFLVRRLFLLTTLWVFLVFTGIVSSVAQEAPSIVPDHVDLPHTLALAQLLYQPRDALFTFVPHPRQQHGDLHFDG